VSFGMIIAYCLHMFMNPIKKIYARQLRRDETDTEKTMWKLLRDRRFFGFKFRRQHVIAGFISDFYCHKVKLIVEIDGWVHNKRKDYDNARDMILKLKGYSIIRFSTDDVVENLSGVCRKLESALTRSLSPGERVDHSKAITKQ
jgi:very-short-patch-repair endonuclease